jgi:hypothetical protein
VPTGAYPRTRKGPVRAGPEAVEPPARPESRKQITCPYCEHCQKVSEYAFSVACRHCNRRIELRDLDIRSHLREDIHTGSLVRVLSNGSVRGSVRANEVIVEGLVVGDVVAGGRLRIATSGVVDGNVRTRRLEIEEGAQFKGDANIGQQAFPPPLSKKKRASRARR